MGNNLREKVEKSLEAVRPMLQADGGGIELVDIDEEQKIASVRFQGACMGCIGASATLEYGVAEAVRKHVPEIKEVRLV